MADRTLNSLAVKFRRIASRGYLIGASGSPINRGTLMLTSIIGGAMTGLSTQITPDGSFLFSNIAPG